MQPRAPREPAASAPGGNARGTPATLRIDLKWAWHHKILVSLRDRLLARQGEKLREAIEPIERHSMHDADSATDEFDHDLAFTLLAADQSALTEITDAIQRIVDGTYGTCQATGVQLPKERLRAIPWCRYSREVEERLEKRGAVKFPRVPRVYSIGGAEDAFATAGETAELPAEPVAGQFKPEEATEEVEPDARPGPGREANAARPRGDAHAASKKRK
ncbi:MAG: TraR/DksA family transcriptional regulator [Verrucomicrobia bacterium]|nr:TraR/DksA family transcriptional regulator [Verrucomicrobiota bacterium]